jgi:hypothetical protein
MSDLLPDRPMSRRERRAERHLNRRRNRWVLAVIGVVVLVLVALAALGAGVFSRWWNQAATVAVPAPLLPNAPTVNAPPKAAPFRVDGVGYDLSYPQCGDPLPKAGAFAIVGVNGGAPLTSNKCLSEQSTWSQTRKARALYLNTAYGGEGDPIVRGKALVDDAVKRKEAAGVPKTGVWWLDVETTNNWLGTPQENATLLASMAARLQELGVRVGIYSTPQQFAEIAGDWAPGLPVWNATGPGTQEQGVAACSESFAGSTTAIVQWIDKESGRDLDHNLICPAWRDRAGELLDPN